MKLLAPLILALTVVAAQPFPEGLAGRPAKRGHSHLEKNDVIADKQAWKRTGDWHGVSFYSPHSITTFSPRATATIREHQLTILQHHDGKCSDFLCNLQCKKQGFCRSACVEGKCQCTVRRNKWGKCNVPSKTPEPPHPKPTDDGHSHGGWGNEDDQGQDGDGNQQ